MRRPKAASWFAPVLAIGAMAHAQEPPRRHDAPIRIKEFLFETAPFPSCHASTIAEVEGGLVASWFGGRDEGEEDVGIWVSRHDGRGWSAPKEVATGELADGRRFPCWNPVLFRAGDRLWLPYKVGPSPDRWWGMQITSRDGGATWSAPERLPEGILGPIKNKPVLLADGTLLCPSSTEHDGWRIHLERTADLGASWTRTPPLNDDPPGLIQPTILDHGGGKLQMLSRSQQGRIFENRSADGGLTWSKPEPIDLPNPNSGIDAVKLADGRSLLVYNHTKTGRSPLNVAISPDGHVWKPAVILEGQPGEFSYPAVIQAADGLVHVTYTWNREKIRHVVLDPKKVE